MKEQILEISKRLDNGKTDAIKAQRELCVLFGVIKRYSLETYAPRCRQGCEWFILDGKTDCIIKSYTSKEIELTKTKLLELNAL